MRKRKNKNRKIVSIIIIVLLLGIIFSYQVFKNKKLEIPTMKENKNNNNNNDKNQNDVVENDVIDESIFESLSILEKLKYRAKSDSRLNKFVKNYDNYPEQLMESVVYNEEIIDFALNYNGKITEKKVNDIGTVQKGVYPLLIQFDAKWGYNAYGDGMIAISGCGPTSLAMILAGLTGKNDTTPVDIAQYAVSQKYYTTAGGTSWSLMSEGSKHYGLIPKELPLDKNVVFRELNNGHPIILNVGPGDFTRYGHYIVVTNVKDGLLQINDPNSRKRSSQLWDFDNIKSQIKNLWSFQLA